MENTLITNGLVLLIVGLIVISGCMQQSQPQMYVCSSGDTTSNPKLCPPEQSVPKSPITINEQAEQKSDNKLEILQPIKVGDTIPEIATGISKHNLSLTLINWEESSFVVDGPYSDGWYTFTAKDGMKFIILTYEIRNNWVKIQVTPYMDAGEIKTNKNYFYEVWHPPIGVWSEEYKPKKAMPEEISKYGFSAGYEKLMQEKSIRGIIVFEIPKGETPIEAEIVYVPNKITFS